jgi:hypothetical protein
MATAPFQLWIDLPSVASAVRVSSTVTVTTTAAHGLTTGTYVQLEGFTGTAGTSMNGVFAATVTSGTTFTVSDAGSAGTATSGSAVVSRDLFSPLIDITSANRQAAAYVIPETLSMSASGDGNSSTFGFQVAQDDTPSDGPWWTNTPDQARIRLYKVATGTAPTDADLYFIGTLAGINATLNGSGQGSITDVTVDEVNAILDKLVVIGKAVSTVNPVAATGFVRTGTTPNQIVTVTTAAKHNFPIGQQVQISGVIGGGSNMNGTFSVTTIPSSTKFTYSTGTGQTNGTGNVALTPTAAALGTGSRQTVELTFAVDHNLVSGSSVTLQGFVCSTTKFTNLLNASFSGKNVAVGSTSKKLLVRLAEELDAVQTVTTRGTVKGDAKVTPIGAGSAQQNFTVPGGLSEDAAASSALSRINDAKGDDPVIQRLLNTAGTASIVGAGSSSANTIGFTMPSGSLRSILDGIVEAFAGEDKKQRRYFIDLNRALNYRLVDTNSKPTYATAPYKIITTGTQDPNTTTAAATVMPFSLNVAYDYNTVKSALFNISSEAGSGVSKVQNYLDADYTERKGAPILDDVVDYPTSSTNPAGAVSRAAKSYFLEQHLPMQTINFTLRGAGTAAHNVDGFSAGYYQTGAATFALQKRWEPGQWVSITCAELNLSGLYRVEQVDWNLMPGSFFQEIRITANRRTPNSIVDIIKKGKKGR